MNDLKMCSVCNTQREFREPITDGFRITCSRCGKFEISGTSYAALVTRISEAEEQYPYAKYILSFWIRNRFEHNKKPINFNIEDIIPILTNFSLPELNEQCNNLITYLGDNIFPYSEFKKISLETLEAIIGLINDKELLFIQQYLYNKGYIRISGHNEEKLGILKASDNLGLTYEGWDLYHELKKADKESNYAFVAMDYNDPEIARICETHFKPAVALTGFELRLLRDYPKAGIIDNKLRTDIRRCKFLLADLTHDNKGAYWESGYAEGLGKPVIYMCKKEKFDKEKTHFDTNHCTTIIWDVKDLSQSLENLKATIRTTFPTEARMND